MDARSGHTVGKDEYQILSCHGREDRYFYVKVYEAKHQEYGRMYVGGYVKVNAWIPKVRN